MDTNHVRTSGAYILYNGLFPFQVGPTRKGDKLGVVRLGGHREGNETALETAIREVFEESSMKIRTINSPITFFKKGWDDETKKVKTEETIAPILIKGTDPAGSTAMYLGYSDSEPRPSSETNGLLLLTSDDIQRICKGGFTLRNYLAQGGSAVLKTDINTDLPLQPFPQLLFLHELLEKEKRLMGKFLLGELNGSNGHHKK
ncbi:DNA mismatch repair protein MutT [Mesobacillus jeotgali]|uniref:DNA mismatch repair protein MutT n=1 Tax=Mesobacillus jeotgali TaxID=129985 RepID=UPI0009A7AEB8|nr:DNA mismatch repair protein MutT [Mesobacillus jeotgali]